MRIGVIGAMQIEVDNLKASMSDISTKEYSGVTYVCGTIGDKEVVAAVCGIGKVFAAICAEAMILEFHVDYVINIGVGGTLCKELGVMDVAVADKVVQHDMNTTPLGDPVGLLSGINEVYLPTDEKMCRLLGSCLAEKGIHYHVGTIATGDLFVSTPEQKTKIHERFDAIACEMEGGSIGHVCYVNKVPFAILRSISDGEGASMDYATFAEKAALQFRELERVVLLKVIDRKWMDHIDDMDQLRQGIGLQAYGQRDPLVEYKMAGFDMFDEMIAGIQEDTIRLLYHVQVEQKVEREQVAKVTGTNKDESAAKAPKKREHAKVYPNDPCPCGSGKKYKQCCGRKVV